MEKLLPTEVFAEDLPQECDTFDKDLKLLDQNKMASHGRSFIPQAGRVRDSEEINLDDKINNTSAGLSKTSKRNRSDSEASSSVRSSESPKPGQSLKLLSVLVKPDSRQRHADEAKRKTLIESQRNDKQIFDRNRRMFGMLMGTLKQFKTEETGRERLTIKRSKIEEKLELAVEKERACVNEGINRVVQPEQYEEVSSDRDDPRDDILGRFKNWEHSHQHLCSYIQTASKPKIFWLPKEHNSITEKRLKETKDYYGLCIAERTAKLRKELDDFDNKSKGHDKPSRQIPSRDLRESYSRSSDDNID